MVTTTLRRIRLVVLLAASATAIGLPRPARAERTESAAVVVSGKADQKTLKQIETVSSDYLRSLGWSLNDKASVNVGGLASCVLEKKTQCVAELTASLSVDRVLLLTANPERSKDGVDAVVLTGWFLAGADGSLQAVDRRYCERCLAPQMEESIMALVDAMVKQLRSRQGYGVVTVRTSPGGALVSIDGSRVGNANMDMEFGVSLGPHRVVLAMDGYEPVERIITIIEDGMRLNLDLKLTKSKSMPLRPVDGSPSGSATKWLVGGGGLLLVAGGIVMLGSNGSESRADDRARDRSEYTVAGLSLTAVGVAALGVSGYLFYRESRRPAAHAAVAFDGNSLLVGVAGSF
jgi:hypothetical protein